METGKAPEIQGERRIGIFQITCEVPITLLEAWIGCSGATKSWLASEAGVTPQTIRAAATPGGSLSTNLAKRLNAITGLELGALVGQEARSEWVLRLGSKEEVDSLLAA